jgi:hypothetical protein
VSGGAATVKNIRGQGGAEVTPSVRDPFGAAGSDRHRHRRGSSCPGSTA